MTRKTRQEKIIAELRRKLETSTSIQSPAFNRQQTTVNLQPIPVHHESTATTKGQTTSPSTSFTLNEANMLKAGKLQLATYNPIYIKKDLTKTLILTILAISFELVIYWLWNK